MRIKIVLEGTEKQIQNFIANVVPADSAKELISKFIDHGLLEVSTEVDNPVLFDALEALSWSTFHLGVILMNKASGENEKGVYMTISELTNYKLNEDGDTLSEREIRSRVAGARKVSERHGATDIMRIKTTKGTEEKRYYLSADVIPTFQQYLDKHRKAYEEWLEDEGYFFPGREH